MEFDEITITKLNFQDGRYYLMIVWHINSFEMYIYGKSQIYKGRFSPARLTGFSRNLNMTEEEYRKTLKRCLAQNLPEYRYELKSGFFYWKRKLHNTVVIEGFLPVELVSSSGESQPNLIEILLSLNMQLRDQVNGLLTKYRTIKTDYKKCLKDTEDFLKLKIDMEKSLCTKFLNLIKMKEAKIEEIENSEMTLKEDVEMMLLNAEH